MSCYCLKTVGEIIRRGVKLEEGEKPEKKYFEYLIPNCTLVAYIFPSWGFRLRLFEPLKRKSIWEKIASSAFLVATGLGILMDVHFWRFDPARAPRLKGTYTVIGIITGLIMYVLLIFLFLKKIMQWNEFLLREAEEKRVRWESQDFVVNLKNYEKAMRKSGGQAFKTKNFQVISRIGVLFLYEGFEHIAPKLEVGKKVEQMKRLRYRFHPQFYERSTNKIIAPFLVAYTSDHTFISLIPVEQLNPFGLRTYTAFELGSMLDHIVQVFPELEDQDPVYYSLKFGEAIFRGGAPLNLDLQKLLGTD